MRIGYSWRVEPYGFALGAVSTGYAFVQFRRRMLQPERLSSLSRMRERWGERDGARMHLISHIILPAVFGLAMWLRASL